MVDKHASLLQLGRNILMVLTPARAGVTGQGLNKITEDNLQLFGPS
jgi:hypothetical protein